MRVDVHGRDGPHGGCPDPGRCDCECRGCKRAWIEAGRPVCLTFQEEPNRDEAEEALRAKYG